MEKFIRRLKADFFRPVGKRWPSAYGHVEQVSERSICVYMYLPPDEAKHRDKFVKFIEDSLFYEILTMYTRHKSNGLTLTGEIFCIFWAEVTEPLYVI